MNILLVNQIYERRGGASGVLFGIEDSLRRHGHRVNVFASSTQRGAGDTEHRLIESFNRARLGDAGRLKKLGWAAEGIYSLRARRALGEFVREFSPDVAIVLKPEYQLTPAVIDALRAARVPVLQWLVDYRPWCAQGQFYNPTLHEKCTRCANGNQTHAIRFRCDSQSLALSVFGAAARTLTTSLLRIPWSADRYVVPTDANRRFLATTVGIRKDRVSVIPHPFDVSRFAPAQGPANGPLVYFGTMVPGKGLWTLARAMTLLPGEQLTIYGVDDLGIVDRYRVHLRDCGVEDRVAIDTRTRMGPVLQDKLRAARMLVNPSEWPDCLDYALLEGMALGKPVLVGDGGGNAEFVTHGVNGFHFRAGDPASLAATVRAALSDPDRLAEIGRRARRTVEERLAPDSFYAALSRALDETIAERRASMRAS